MQCEFNGFCVCPSHFKHVQLDVVVVKQRTRESSIQRSMDETNRLEPAQPKHKDLQSIKMMFPYFHKDQVSGLAWTANGFGVQL